MIGPLTNARHERFAQELAKGESQSAAYVVAGYKPDDGAASRLSGNVKVRARVTELQARAAEKAVVDAAWVLKRLADEATADVGDLYTDDGRIKPVHEWPLIWRQGLVAGLEVETIGEGIGHLTKVKLSDRIKRIELIGKHVGVQAFKEKIEHSGEIKHIVDLSDETLAAIAVGRG